MSNSKLPKAPPHVQHNFEGDVKILNATFDTRSSLRTCLTKLAQEVQKIEAQPVEVVGEITIKVGGQSAKMNSYTISITNSTFNTFDFARQVTPSQEVSAGTMSKLAPQAPKVASKVYGSGREVRAIQSSTGLQSNDRNNTEEALEVRPFKRVKVNAHDSTPTATQSKTQQSASQEVPKNGDSSEQIKQLLAFVREWHQEWKRQGGWLFDNITQFSSKSDSDKAELEKKLEAVQDVLGQSLNSASEDIMTQLVNISKMGPWLEGCRKESDEQVQAREEKWRSSSATFHDQARRDRELAESKITKQLEEQRELLLKLARASGVKTDSVGAAENESDETSREGSLGAQLTRELNMEVAKSGTDSRSRAADRPTNVDDNG